jgi:hypothetical protein
VFEKTGFAIRFYYTKIWGKEYYLRKSYRRRYRQPALQRIGRGYALERHRQAEAHSAGHGGSGGPWRWWRACGAVREVPLRARTGRAPRLPRPGVPGRAPSAVCATRAALSSPVSCSPSPTRPTRRLGAGPVYALAAAGVHGGPLAWAAGANRGDGEGVGEGRTGHGCGEPAGYRPAVSLCMARLGVSRGARG